jgi:GTP-binding protein HflX
MEAFHATLEELSEADIILHVIDVSNPRYEQQKKSVEKILTELDLDRIPTLYVFNKLDQVDLETFDNRWLLNQGVMVSATQKQTLVPLVEKLESMVHIQ